ncbi:MAG: NAD(P)-dependent oxidoreductase [Gemmataceae bacterium]|nr:NAD(P)-dependent oxidoreductase [Gemmataceae bacterium]
MHIAVTGGTGFIGRYMLRQLVRSGHRLRCWHRATSDRGGLDDVTHGIEWRQGNLLDPSCAEFVAGVDALVHGAVEWGGGSRRSAEQDDVLRFLDANLMGSLRLFHTAKQAGVKRFIYIASCAVHEVILDDRPLDETHPLWPTSHYGAHKAALEKFVHSYGLGDGWPICSLRPTGVYGVNHPASDSRYFELVGQVLRGESIASARGGKEVHAADVARAVELLLNTDERAIAGQAFNCYDSYIAEQTVARIAKELTGSPSTIADLNRGPKHQIDTKKIRALGMTFGGEPLLRQTVAELIAAHGARPRS